MFASQRGVGYLLVKAMESNEATTITALALLLIVFATCASWILLAIDNRLNRRT
jgi:NitT/TauT family transport system permease protein